MQGQTMDYQLTLPALLKRADDLFGKKEIVTRLPDKSLHRYTYADFVERSKRLGVALKNLGLEESDRVATLAWNQYQHLEAYFGVPCAGLVLHTINPRLAPQEIAYILNHADDRVLFVDETLVKIVDAFKDDINLEHIFVYTAGDSAPEGFTSYEDFIKDADVSEFEYPQTNEDDAAALCYTSGTTGRPKGVLYSHRCLCLHSLLVALPDAFDFKESDVVLPVVPMFHVNAWGIPVTSVMIGCKQVMPGPHLDADSLLSLFQDEEVTFTAGVPTIWMGILQALEKDPEKYDLSKLAKMGVGGSAAPEAMIRAYEKHGLKILHAWGMTEMTPVGTVGYVSSELQKEPEDVQYKYRAKQGIQLPFVEIRARGDEGFVPWDGSAMGELEVRGPTVASAYFSTDEGADKFTDDGWFRTGDVVSITPGGYVEIRDRDKDLVKSGGEWISSVDLENTLMGHEAVLEAAVIAIPDEKWDERPLAVVVLKEGHSATSDELGEHLARDFAKWQLPDAYEFVDEIPRTATGKFLKMALREQFEGYEIKT